MLANRLQPTRVGDDGRVGDPGIMECARYILQVLHSKVQTNESRMGVAEINSD